MYFAEYCLCYRALLQKETIILSILLTEATPYRPWVQLPLQSTNLSLSVHEAEYRLFYRALLQKKPIILRSLLIVATPYLYKAQTCLCLSMKLCITALQKTRYTLIKNTAPLQALSTVTFTKYELLFVWSCNAWSSVSLTPTQKTRDCLIKNTAPLQALNTVKGWLRLVGSLKVYVSFAMSPIKETIFCRWDL